MIHEPEVLDEVGQVFLAELETMPLAELDRLIKRVTAAKEAAREYEQFLQATLNHRFSERAQELRRQAGKTTGVVRLEEDGYVVIADLPKKPEYDQRKLKDAVEALRKWGENPEDYVSLEIKVSETKYNAWPPGVRQLFEPARTLKVGKPTYKLEQLKPGDVAAAANDSMYCEEH
jgi:hypothetical protein